MAPAEWTPEQREQALRLLAAYEDGPRAVVTPRPPCRHLGPPTGESRDCPTCSGKVALKLFACAVHAACTPGKALPGVANCPTCPDHSAPAE